MALSEQQTTFDESWAAAVSIPMTMVTGLFVNLLSQEWRVGWPLSIGALVVLGLAQFLLLRHGPTAAAGKRVHGISEAYLVGLGVTAVIGFSANWVAVRAWAYDVDAPVFESSHWALVVVAISVVPWLMAHAKRPTWMWATALFAGFCGAQFALNTGQGTMDRLGWWVFAVVVVWLTARPSEVLHSLRELTKK